MEASTALNRAVYRLIERPSLNRAVTALFRVPVVPSDLTASLGDTALKTPPYSATPIISYQFL